MIGRITKGAARAIGARAGSILASFILTIAVARLLGAADAGWFFLASTTMTLIATFGRFGSDLLALRICGGDSRDVRGELRHSAVLALTASIAAIAAVAAVVVATGFRMPGVSLTTLVILLTAVVPQAFAVLAGAVLRGRGRLGTGVIAELGSIPVLTLLFVFGLHMANALTLESALLSSAVASWLTAAWAVPFAIVSLAGTAPASEIVTILDFVRTRGRTATSMMAASLLYFLFAWMPLYVLSAVSTVESVSFYTVAARLANLMTLIPSIQISYLSPLFARLFHTEEIHQLNDLCARATRQAAALLVLPAIVLTAAGTPFVVVFYGEGFAASGPVLSILAAGTFLTTLFGQVNQLTLLCGLEGRALTLNAFVIVAWLLVGTWLSAIGGSIGAAAFTVAVSIAYAAIAAFLLLRERGVRSYLRFSRRRDESSLESG